MKRVWNLRSALKLMDFENQSSDYLKNLLENCMMHASFVKNEKVSPLLVTGTCR